MLFGGESGGHGLDDIGYPLMKGSAFHFGPLGYRLAASGSMRAASWRPSPFSVMSGKRCVRTLVADHVGRDSILCMGRRRLRRWMIHDEK